MARQSPEPSMYRHRPASELTQDISHLLSRVFKDLYTSEVIGKDTVENMIKSRGGENVHHEKFVEELQEIRSEYNRRLTEADMLERHIIQARARATAEEERFLNKYKEDVPENYKDVPLPPVKSYFRWCVDDELLEKHHLIRPEEYITDPEAITRAPKVTSGPHYLKEIFSFKQYMKENKTAPKFKQSPRVKKILENLPDVSLSHLTLESLGTEILEQTGRSFPKKKFRSLRKPTWKDAMSRSDRQKDRAYLRRLDDRHNFLKNPRYFPPNSHQGGKSLIFPQKKVERMVAGRLKTMIESDSQSVPVFLPKPPAVVFTYYEVGQVYEMTVEFQNMTSTSQNVRIIPPATSAFAIDLGVFPGEGGLVAPGMSCQYKVQFIPEYLADYDDYILVETQSTYPVLVPLKGRRPPPILTLPRVLDCGACLVGGVKFNDFLCKNISPSIGKFCIMPKSLWPPSNFRSVATIGFVEQEPFGVRPAVFELAPGQSTTIEVVFLPLFPEVISVNYTIACDNCQINDITVTGLGQLIALKLLSVSGGESSPLPGEFTDVSAQHLVRFDSLNPFSTEEKTMVLRNLTHVELRYFWQIMKPNLQPLMLERKMDPASIKYNLETESAFSVHPAMGVLQPHSDHAFTITYAPTKLKEYHSVLQIVLENIPELPDPRKQEQYGFLEGREEDVIALEIDIKGQTEPFKLLLEPYAVIIPGEHYIGVNIRRHFKMYNNSKSLIKFTWANINDCDILEILPLSGKLGSNDFCEFEFIMTGGKPGHSVHDVLCEIMYSEEPVVLHVEAVFKGPALSIDVPSFDLGLLKLGQKVICTFEITNQSQLSGKWKMQESPACLAERNETASQFTIQPASGELLPLGTCTVSILFKPLFCQRLQTVLEMEVENGEGSHIPLSVEVQTPQVCLISSHLEFDLSIGILAKATVQLFNQTRLPTHFRWGELLGNQAPSCVFSISPVEGTLGPNEEKEFLVELTTHTKDKLSNLTLFCYIEDMKDPLVLAISGEVKGLHITYSIPFDSDEEQPEHSQDIKLDFGSEVALKSVVKRQLNITNHSELSALFTIKVEYFTTGLPDEKDPDVFTDANPEKARRITRQIVKRRQSAFRATMLSYGRGAAFHVHPSSGILNPFEELVVEITAYNNMWGEYQDNLICEVGEGEPVLIPMQMTVKGCPIFLQITGPDHPVPTPIIRFGAHISGGDTVSRNIRLNNPTPFDIRMDWESYNQDKDDDKLIDLLVFYGPPFPIKDADGNEIEVLWDPDEKISTATSHTSYSVPPVTQKENQPLDTILEDDEGTTSDSGSFLLLAQKKIISVVIRPHEGVPSDYPFCITPKQIVIPAGGSAAIHISFTPLMLPEIINKFECEGFSLGFMSLDRKSSQEGRMCHMLARQISTPYFFCANTKGDIIFLRLAVCTLKKSGCNNDLRQRDDRNIPGKVTRGDGHAVAPLRIDLQAFVKPALLTIEMDHERGLVFHAMASDLIPEEPFLEVLMDAATTLNLKLTNDTETPLTFKLFLETPFSVTGVDPIKSLITAHSNTTIGVNHFLLYALQNMQVKISFHTTLEILTYQHLPEDQLLPGLQVLQLESGDKILEFKQDLIIEYSNNTRQVLPMSAYLTVPVLELSCEIIDFETCLVGQTRSEAVLVMNKSKSRSYWTALLEKEERHKEPEVFSICPCNGILEPHKCSLPTKTPLLVRFTPREDKAYETIVTVVGVLGERPCMLQLKGRGSYDEKYEERFKS